MGHFWGSRWYMEITGRIWDPASLAIVTGEAKTPNVLGVWGALVW